MPKFEIIQDSPYQFKKQILSFWEEYLPDTPPARLEWMENNPAGSAIWLFAVEEKTGTLAGTMSLFPKDLFLNGKKIKAAILGDFMLHKKFRVFGPALNLLKATVARQRQGEFAFLYTVPNLKSKKIAERVGFRPAGRLYSMMCPQQCDFFLEKYVSSFAAKALQQPLMLTLRLFSRATYGSSLGFFEEIDWRDEKFDMFCQQLNAVHSGLITSDCSLEYLDWRYRQNPEFDFQIYIFKKRPTGDIQGFFVFSLDGQRLELYDMVSLDRKITMAMLKHIYIMCKKSNGRGVYSSIYEHNPLLAIVKKCCFFDTKDKVEIYTYPEDVRGIENWAFTSADRNI